MFAAWDNVASLLSTRLDRASKKPFHFVGHQLTQNIEKAYHALALDEKRKDFKPLVLTGARQDQLKQCWFLGSHGDVGGGGENAGLANISLCWMICRLKSGIQFNAMSIWNQTSEGKLLKKSETRGGVKRIIGAEKYDSFIGKWKIRGKHPREVGKSKIQDKYRDGNEKIHISVRAFYEWADPEKRRQSEPLKSFSCSNEAPDESKHQWTGFVGGQNVKVDEDTADRYERRMLHRWVDSDREFWGDVGPQIGVSVALESVPLDLAEGVRLFEENALVD
jgi:hypothetical protein